MSEPPARVLTVADCAIELAVSTETVRSWIRRGITIHGHTVRLSASRSVGHRYRVTDAEIAQFLASCLRHRGLHAAAEIPTAAERRREEIDARRRGDRFLNR